MMRILLAMTGILFGNFKSGFDASLWEFYLYGYLCEEELFLDRKFHADFVVKNMESLSGSKQ